MRMLELRQKGAGTAFSSLEERQTEQQPTVTAALVAIVILGTGLVFVLLLCYACVLRRLCCPDFGRRTKPYHQNTRSTTTQHTSCDITKFDTLTAERSPS